jgi:hypothetical protein
MAINTPDLRFLQSIIASPSDKRVSEVARRCSEEFKIGARVGQRFVYGAGDVDKAIALLQAHGLPTIAAELTDRAGAVNRPGLSEKAGTTAPHQDSVAYRIFRQGTPDGPGYCVATCHEVSAMTASTMMVVENFETFRQLHRYKWVLQRMHAWDTCLVVFRGDTYYPLSDAHQCVSASALPQIGFHDFDPAGLHMSLGLPGLVEHLIPPMEVLEEVVQVGKRSALYFGQLGQYGHSLESAKRANISELWAAMKRMQKGYPQEWMRDIR